MFANMLSYVAGTNLCDTEFSFFDTNDVPLSALYKTDLAVYVEIEKPEKFMKLESAEFGVKAKIWEESSG